MIIFPLVLDKFDLKAYYRNHFAKSLNDDEDPEMSFFIPISQDEILSIIDMEKDGSIKDVAAVVGDTKEPDTEA